MNCQPISRRRLLGTALSAAGALALPRLGFGAAADAAQSLGAALTLLMDTGSNVLVLETREGLVLVDSGAAAGVEVLLSRLDTLGGKAPKALFNTHWHEEHVGGNAALGERGAEIIAHAKTRAHLATDYYLPHEERYHRALPQAGIPVTTFHTDDSRDIGDNRIDYGYLRQAHTDGDIYVFLREQNVLAVGDVVSPLLDPAIDWYGGGWLGGRVDAMDQLLAMADADTRIVPGTGPVLSRAQLQAERDLMGFLYEKTVDLMREGKSAQQMLEEGLMDSLPRRFADPYRFLYDNYKGLWAHHNKLAPNVV
ncbi:MAG TPA: MBL fold metallo-hydrolase [Hyphomicrobiales bacterium]|nr:MBL fold metallo-hydrolase [Hyphomicrobiales bacterium]